MDDMTALDRLLTSEVQREAGPSQPVNDAAIFTAITTTQSPKWRFQSMFSATKFVVAGAILALFGGFLLTGVLTQPGEERPPAVGASASAHPGPTDALTAEPETSAGVGRFAPTGSLIQPRSKHTATRLLDGRVLVVGGATWVGDSRREYAPTAEIWDPATGSFTETGAPTEARSRHTATLLQDGRVLVVGGNDRGLDSAEVWDPATGSFAPAGTSNEPHGGGHTATLLADGRVLVVGGHVLYGVSSAKTAELWDPATASFSTVDGLSGLHDRSVTLLSDGRVLFIGQGGTESSISRTAQVWDPITGALEPAGQPLEPRRGHTATLLHDGRVLVVGGDRGLEVPPARRQILEAEVWDPETTSFSPAGTLAERRGDHTATLLPDGRVLVIGGGATNNAQVRASAEVWDPATEDFAPAGSLAEGRFDHTATLLTDGRVLTVGGESDVGRDLDWDRTVTSTEIWAADQGQPTARVAETDTTTTPDLLPGVDLVTEELEPGVYRVLSDGVRDLTENNRDVLVGDDGAVWVAVQVQRDADESFRNGRVVRLGSPGRAVRGPAEPEGRRYTFQSLPDGTITLSPAALVLAGDEWIEATSPALRACSHPEPRTGLPLPPDAMAGLRTRDGGCWAGNWRLGGFLELFDEDDEWRIGQEPGGRFPIVRADDDGSVRLFEWADIGLEDRTVPGHEAEAVWVGFAKALADDGTLWATIGAGQDRLLGLLRHDGETWEIVPFESAAGNFQPNDMEVTPDGTVWLAEVDGFGNPDELLASWDGQTWRDHGGNGGTLGVGPDGTLWIDDVSFVDGGEVRTLDLPAKIDTERAGVHHAADGSIWIASDGLYVVTADGVAAAVERSTTRDEAET